MFEFLFLYARYANINSTTRILLRLFINSVYKTYVVCVARKTGGIRNGFTILCHERMSMSRLSIIIPVYNAADYLDVCMYRLIDQVRRLRRDEYGYVTDNPDSLRAGIARDSVEIIAVDDGSTDRSLIILKEYADRYDFVKLIHQDNAGPAAARNAGLRVASGDWVWFIDPDDYADEDALEVIFEAVSRATDSQARDGIPDVIIFDAYEHIHRHRSGRHRRHRDNGTDNEDIVSVWEHFGESCVFTTEENIRVLQRAVLYPREIRALRGRPISVRLPRRIVPLAAPWDKVYRRDFLTENHLMYNEELRVLDDMYFNMEVFGRAKRVEYVKSPIYHYVRNDGSITSSYTADRVSRDLVVWDAIDRYIEANSTVDITWDKLLQACYKRIIRSYAICCKRSIFHPDNPMDRGAQVRYAAKVMRMPEYEEAFSEVKLSGLEWLLRPVAIFGRHKLGWGMWLLSRLERIK